MTNPRLRNIIHSHLTNALFLRYFFDILSDGDFMSYKSSLFSMIESGNWLQECMAWAAFLHYPDANIAKKIKRHVINADIVNADIVADGLRDGLHPA